LCLSQDGQSRVWDEEIHKEGLKMDLIASPAFNIINSNNQTNLPDGI